MQQAYRCHLTVITSWQAYQATTVSWHLDICCILRKEVKQSCPIHLLWHFQPPPCQPFKIRYLFIKPIIIFFYYFYFAIFLIGLYCLQPYLCIKFDLKLFAFQHQCPVFLQNPKRVVLITLVQWIISNLSSLCSSWSILDGCKSPGMFSTSSLISKIKAKKKNYLIFNLIIHTRKVRCVGVLHDNVFDAYQLVLQSLIQEGHLHTDYSKDLFSA